MTGRQRLPHSVLGVSVGAETPHEALGNRATPIGTGGPIGGRDVPHKIFGDRDHI